MLDFDVVPDSVLIFLETLKLIVLFGPIYPASLLQILLMRIVKKLFTNVVEYFYHVLMVDGVSGWEQSGLKTTTPSIIHDLALTAPEEVVIGNALVDQSFHMDSPSLSIDGDLLLEGRIQDLKSQQVSSVRNFTVNGSLSVNDEIELGTGEHGPLESFVNHGSGFSRTQRILSDYVENRGEMNAGSTVTIEADTVKLQSGTIAGKGVSISASHLKMHDSTLPATDRLNILSSFVDSGEEANNLITVMWFFSWFCG